MLAPVLDTGKIYRQAATVTSQLVSDPDASARSAAPPSSQAPGDSGDTRLVPGAAPPPDYYAANLQAVLRHLQAYQFDGLGAAGRAVHHRISACSPSALRLFARLITRQAPVRRDTLNYPEVARCSAALAELCARRLAAINQPVAAELLLHRLHLKELRALFPAADQRAGKRQLLQWLLANHNDTVLRARVATTHHWVNVTVGAALERMLVAYFGAADRDLAQFVVRDLGLVRYEDYLLSGASRAFANAAELNAYLQLERLNLLPHDRREAALGWLLSCPDGNNPSIERRRDRLLNRWGRDFERAGRIAAALACFAVARAHPARERQVRILHAQGRQAAAAVVLAEMRRAPRQAREREFAQRFPGRAKQRRVWQESVWALPPGAPPERIEQWAGTHLTANGGRSWHVENALFCSLLGLTFWDVLFAPVPGMFTQPFQSGPRDLYWPGFREARRSAIRARLQECAVPGALWSRIDANRRDKAGRACALVSWRLLLGSDGRALLRAVRNGLPAALLARIFDYMLDDLEQTRTGLPDLFVSYGARCELVEVKGPGDQLQPNQRQWLTELATLGVPCRVLRLRSPGRG